MDKKPILSCSTLAVRANGRHLRTLEGLQKDAEEFGLFLAKEGGEQCGFCSPGFIMNVLSMVRELDDPTEEEIKARYRLPSPARRLRAGDGSL